MVVLFTRRRVTVPKFSSGGLYDYVKTALSFMRFHALWAFLLLLLVGFMEGIGLLILIPFLHVLGVTGKGDTSSGAAEAVAGVFEAIGVPLTLPSVLVIFVLLIAARAILVQRREIMLADLQYRFVDHLRTRLYAAIGRANWLFLARIRSSDLTHVLTADIGRVAAGTEALLRLAVTGTMLLVYMVVAVALSLTGTLAAVAAGLLLLLVLRPQIRKAHGLGRALTETGREVFGNVTDFLSGIKLAKSYVAEEQHVAAFDASVTALRNRIISFMRSSAFSRTVFQIGGAAALAVVIYLTVAVVQLPPAELLVLIFIFSRLMPMLMGLQQGYQRAMHMLPAFEAAMDMQARCEAAAEPRHEANAPIPRLTRQIRLDGVGFRYDKSKPETVLENIGFVIPANSTTAVTGPSGSGKSTLADLVMGLLEPDAGTIAVDGTVLRGDNCRLWRQAVAYVPQETFLFHDTIRANLLWAQPGASDDDVWEALETAAAAGFVAALPDKLDTVVGERGQRLSGGERQRIALARALLCRPALLILDEATSALDHENERRVQAAINGLHGRITILIIAHRLSTIREADQIVLLDQGRIVDIGTWNELKRQDALL